MGCFGGKLKKGLFVRRPVSEAGEPGRSDARQPAEGPQDGPDAAQKSHRPFVAGVLLLFLLGLGLFNGVLQVASPGGGTDASLRFTEQTWHVEGTVTAANGTPVADAAIVSNEQPGRNATTDADGRYRIDGLATGFNSLNFSHPDHANLTLRLVLLQDASADVRMPPPGDAEVVDHHTVGDQRTIARVWGVLILTLSVVTAAGAVAAYRRRPRKLAIGGCVAGFFAGLPLSIIIAPAALFLVLRDPSEWR